MSNDFRDGETDSGDAEPPPWLRITDTLHEAADTKRRIQALTEADYLRHEQELQRGIRAECRRAEETWRKSHPWLAPGWCVTVPVRRLEIE